MLGFRFGHLGVNCKDKSVASDITALLVEAFHFDVKYEVKSNFVNQYLEIVNNIGPGRFGHIAIKTKNIFRAMHYMQARGFELDYSKANYRESGVLFAIYLKMELEGFEVHLLQES